MLNASIGFTYEAKDLTIVTYHFRSIYGIYCKIIKQNQKITTCNWLDLGTIGFWLIICSKINLNIDLSSTQHGELQVLRSVTGRSMSWKVHYMRRTWFFPTIKSISQSQTKCTALSCIIHMLIWNILNGIKFSYFMIKSLNWVRMVHNIIHHLSGSMSLIMNSKLLYAKIQVIITLFNLVVLLPF